MGPQQGRAPPPDEHGHRPRHWWGQQTGALFAYEYLPVDTTFEIRVSAEAQEPAPDTKKDEDPQSTTQSAETKGTPPASPALVEKALKAVVTLLHGKFISLGGRTGAGWGRIELGPDDIRRTQVAIPAPVAEKEKPSSPLDQLLNPPQPEPLKEAALSTSFPSASTSIEIEWQAPSGLFIGMNKPEGIDSLEKTLSPLRQCATGTSMTRIAPITGSFLSESRT